MRTGLRLAAVLATAIAVPAVVPVPITGPVVAGRCQRSVSIAPQRSGGEGTEKLTFMVFSDGCTSAGTVGYAVTAGTAEANVDFRPQKGRLQWAEGEVAAKTITVPLVQDSDVEAGIEDLTVRLVEPDPSVQIRRAAGQGRILDDDGPALLLVIDDDGCPYPTPKGYCPCPPGIFEFQPNEPNCVFPQLHLSSRTSSPVTTRWDTFDDTAVAGLDYDAIIDGTVTVPSGATMGSLVVRLLPRPPGTPTRWFYLRISAPSNGTIIDGTAVITIGGP